MIILKYWREILIALILAAVCACGWYIKGTIDHNREMAAEVKQQQAKIADLAKQVKQVDEQRKLDNELTRQQLQQRQQQQAERKTRDAVFKHAVQANPVAQKWLDEPLPAATIDRLREPAANPDGQANAASGTAR